MLKHPLAHSLLAASLAICAAVPAQAQQRESDQRNQQQQDRRSNQQSQQRNQSQNQQSSNVLRLDPRGQVVIGVDSNNDGRFEMIRRIYVADLDVAMRRSSDRQRQNGQQGQQGQQSQQRGQMDSQRMSSRGNQSQNQNQRMMNDWQRNQQSGRQQGQGQRGGSQMSSQQNQMRRISGTITEKKTFQLVDGPEHDCVKIETEDGKKVPVDLGRIEDLSQLNLKNGDQVTVYGTRTRMNDKRVLCAKRIEHDGQTLTMKREQDRGLKRVQGEISKLETKSFKNKPHQVAELELNGGRTEKVILGPEDRLSNLDLQSGDKVQLLVRRGTYNDKPALISEQVRHDGNAVSLTSNRNSRQQSGSQQQRGSQQNNSSQSKSESQSGENQQD